MKQITICDKKYDIECNALTYVKYKSFFKSGILKDMNYIENYLIKQTIISKQLEEKDMNNEERLNILSDRMRNDTEGVTTDEFIIKITQIAWILIYTANNKIEEYEKWLSSIQNFSIDDDWIVEVTELAVDCFC